MRVVIFTVNFEMGGVALALEREGVDVVMGVVEDVRSLNSGRIREYEGETEEQRRRRLSILDGMVRKVSADEAVRAILRSRKRSDLVVLFDMNTLFRYAEPLRDLGIFGNFPTEWDRMFEHDRAMAKSFVRRHYPRIEEIPTVGFHRVEEVEEFLRSGVDRVWVLKGGGEARTVVPTSDDPEVAAEELLTALREGRREYEEGGELVLEQKILDPVEVTPERVYVDGQLVYETIDIEGKTIGAFEVGPQVGCGMDVVFSTEWARGLAEWVEEVAFPPVVDEMAARSPGIFVWDASLLIEGRTGRVYFGEFCSNRFGYNSLYTEIELSGGSALEWLEGLRSREVRLRRGVGASVRLFQMNRDRRGYFQEEEVVLRGHEGVWLFGVKRDDRGRLVTGGLGDRSAVGEDIAVVTGWGGDGKEAAHVVYERVKQVHWAGMYWRKDLWEDGPRQPRRRYEYLMKLVGVK